MNRLTTSFQTIYSFLEGAAKLFDFGGSLSTYKYADFPKRSSFPHKSDMDALASDWMAVGGDLRRAMKQCGEKENITLDDSVIQEARNQLMQDKTMQELVALRKKLD